MAVRDPRAFASELTAAIQFVGVGLPAPAPRRARPASHLLLDMPNIQQQVDEMVNLLEQMKGMLNK